MLKTTVFNKYTCILQTKNKLFQEAVNQNNFQ